VLVGLGRPDDAGVYRLSDDVAIVQTVDFFTPIVDDPFTFGQIAATNSLSDVYAMGARPVSALNIVCFDEKAFDIEVLHEILRGGVEKASEAGVPVIGGHSVEAPEIKYGLAVNGIVHPDKIIASSGAQPGDRLVLTKALGTGIIATALKAGLAPDEALAASTASMLELNAAACEVMTRHEVHACTDVTGFGLVGHACEMLEGSQTGMEIKLSAVPVLPGVAEAAASGLLPAGLHRNRGFRSDDFEAAGEMKEFAEDILFDPQTSGGLLIAVAADDAEALVGDLHSAGVKRAAVIGEITAEHPCKVRAS